MNPSQGMAVEEWETLGELHSCMHVYPRWQQHGGCDGARVKALEGGGVPGCSGIEGLLRVLLKCERSQCTTNDVALTKLYPPNPEPQSCMPCDGHHGHHNMVETACSHTVHCAIQLVLQISMATAAMTVRRHHTTVGIWCGAHP